MVFLLLTINIFNPRSNVYILDFEHVTVDCVETEMHSTLLIFLTFQSQGKLFTTFQPWSSHRFWWQIWCFLTEEVVQCDTEGLVAVNSLFGWVLSGSNGVSLEDLVKKKVYIWQMFCSQRILQVMKLLLVKYAVSKCWESQKKTLSVTSFMFCVHQKVIHT